MDDILSFQGNVNGPARAIAVRMSARAEHHEMVVSLLHQNLLRVCASSQGLMLTQTFQTSLKCRLILAPLVVVEIPRQRHLAADLILSLVHLGLT